jgi:very-short-patch-repair endonuclease
MTLYTLGDAANAIIQPQQRLAATRPDTMLAILDLAEKRFRARLASHSMSDEAIESSVTRAREEIGRLHQHAESPIERALAPWLVMEDYGPVFGSILARVHIPKVDLVRFRSDITIVPQYAILKYRLDFAVVGKVSGHDHIVGVECDGDDFHAGPLGQSNDLIRDGYLLSWGIPVIRASGKEIYTRGPGVVARAAEALMKLVDERRRG